MEVTRKWGNCELGAALVEALGLPKRTTSVDISMKAGGPLNVRCEYLPDDMQPASAERMIAEFRQIRMQRVTGTIDDQFEQLLKAIAAKTELRCDLALNEIHRMGTKATHQILSESQYQCAMKALFAEFNSMRHSAEEPIWQ